MKRSSVGAVADLELEEPRSCERLLGRSPNPELERRRTGILHGSDQELRMRRDPPARQIPPLGEGPRHRDQLGAVDVEDVLGLGLIPGGHIVTGQTADVLDPVHRRAHQVGLQSQPVSIAAGELHDRLHAGAAHPDGHREGRRVRMRGRVVGRVEGVYEGLHGLQLTLDLALAPAVDHGQLGGHDEPPRGELALKVRHPSPPPSPPEPAGHGH
jgi:hypothetical protein